MGKERRVIHVAVAVEVDWHFCGCCMLEGERDIEDRIELYRIRDVDD